MRSADSWRLTTAQGEYTLTVNAADIQDQNGVAGTNSLSTSWLMDTSAPSSHVVNSLGTSQTSDTFPVSVTFSDPAGPGNAPAAGVSAVQLWVSVNNGAFSLYQTMDITPTASGTVNFSFTGQDRNIYAFHSIAIDAAGNTESKSSTATEASTSVPDLHPPVTQVLNDVNVQHAGSLHDQLVRNRSRPEHRHARWIDRHGGYLCRDRRRYQPTLIDQINSPTASSGVYSGSLTYPALADGASHNYSFYSIGIDDEQKVQAIPAQANQVTFTGIVYSNPLAVENLVVEKGIAERSFIQYLDVDFNQTASSSPALQSLAAALQAQQPDSSYLELLWYGDSTPSASSPKGSVNLFNAGTTASVTLTGNDLSINFGPNGITSLLSGGRSGTQADQEFW